MLLSLESSEKAVDPMAKPRKSRERTNDRVAALTPLACFEVK